MPFSFITASTSKLTILIPDTALGLAAMCFEPRASLQDADLRRDVKGSMRPELAPLASRLSLRECQTRKIQANSMGCKLGFVDLQGKDP
jgi:hypothetical protein